MIYKLFRWNERVLALMIGAFICAVANVGIGLLYNGEMRYAVIQISEILTLSFLCIAFFAMIVSNIIITSLLKHAVLADVKPTDEDFKS